MEENPLGTDSKKSRPDFKSHGKKTLKHRLRGFFFSERKISLRHILIQRSLKRAEESGNVKKAAVLKAKLEVIDGVKSKILIKYIAKELFLYFFVCFLFFFVVFFVNQILLLAETILKQRVPVPAVIKLITYCLPAIIAQSAPFATLVGFLMCLGRMVTDNEILILRASGQRYSLILVPVIIMGILISVFSFVMNDYFLPLGTLNYNRMRTRIVQSNPAVQIESNSIKKMKSTALVIGEANDTEVEDLVILDKSGGEMRIILAGKSNVEKSDADGVLMELNMNDTLVFLIDKNNKSNYDVVRADSMKLNMFESLINTSSGNVSPREMTSYDLHKTIEELKKQDELSKKQMNVYELEYHKKFSIPFGSIFFAILAFPLALVFGRRDGQTLGLIFGIIISVMYWAATILGQLFGLRGGYNGFWMMWGPNIFIGILGGLLYLKLRRK